MHPDARQGIKGEKTLLRAICSDDMESLRGFVNNPEVMRFSNVYRPISDRQQESWYQGINRTTDSVWFAVEDIRQHESNLVGTCCLVNIDWVGRSAEFRIRLGDQSVFGGGLGTEASGQLVRYGFMDLNLERIWLRVFASNQRAIHLYTKLGFQVEGELRRAVLIAGSFDNVVLMGLLRDEWQQCHDDRQVRRSL